MIDRILIFQTKFRNSFDFRKYRQSPIDENQWEALNRFNVVDQVSVNLDHDILTLLSMYNCLVGVRRVTVFIYVSSISSFQLATEKSEMLMGPVQICIFFDYLR
jgi:hypothetical protein